ncbi:MAG: OST-HTH/LOTUS domain-containing protein [Candidatus Sulfotelmatobacter sp.]
MRTERDKFVVAPLYRYATFESTHGAELAVGPITAHAEQLIQEEQPGPAAAENDRRFRKRVKQSTAWRRGKERDEFVPSGRPSELVGETALVEELTTQLAGITSDNVVTGANDETTEDSDSPQVPESGRLPNRDVTVPASRSTADAVELARSLGRNGQYAQAFNILYPRYTTSTGAICAAADMAYGSGDAVSIGTARELLSSTAKPSEGAVLGRIIVSALADQDTSGAVQAAVEITPNTLHAATIAITRMIAQVVEKEPGLWKSGLTAFGGQLSAPTMLRSVWPILAASRVLAVCRNRWDETSVVGNSVVGEVLSEIWPEETRTFIQLIIKYLETYSRDPQSAVPRLVPYQILSLMEILDAANALSPDLHFMALNTLIVQVREAASEDIARFLEWGRYCAIALEVAYALQKQGNRRREKRRVATSRNKASTAELEHLHSVVVSILNRNPNGQVMPLSTLGSWLPSEIDGFSPAYYGFTGLLRLLQAVSEFGVIDIGQDANGLPTVRLRPTDNDEQAWV